MTEALTHSFSLPQIEHGHHCCLFFETPEQKVEITLPFIVEGLKRNERCVHVDGPESVELVRRALEGRGIDTEAEAEKGRLILSSKRDYLNQGRFDTDKMLAFLQEAYDSAMADGFTALRASGDVSWEIGPNQDFSNLIYYEIMLDVFFLGKRMVGMCQYPRFKCPPEVLKGILTTHKIAAMDGQICADNVHYMPSQLLLEKDPEAREARRFEWMTSQLVRLKKAEESQAFAMQQLLKEKVELERVNLELDSFVYTASHDLKSPLRGIASFAGVLTEDYKDKLDAQGMDALHEIKKNATKMGELIDDLLALSRVSRINSPTEEVDLNEVMRHVLDRLEYNLAHYGARVRVLPDLPRVYCDRIKITEVLVNLIDNAAKFSSKNPSNHRTIEVGGYQKNGQYEFFVKDNGIGIDPKYHAQIFKMFNRLHTDKEYEGTGTGLYIVKKIVEGHGGKIWLDSGQGKGATFYFSLPISAPEAKQ